MACTELSLTSLYSFVACTKLFLICCSHHQSSSAQGAGGSSSGGHQGSKIGSEEGSECNSSITSESVPGGSTTLGHLTSPRNHHSQVSFVFLFFSESKNPLIYLSFPEQIFLSMEYQLQKCLSLLLL